MPIIIGPAGALKLNDVYNDLVDGATSLTGAAAAIAPAAVREVVCAAGGLASLLGGPLGPLQGPGSRDRLFSDLGGILQAACDVPPPPPILEPSEGPPPFEGGQCEGVGYRVTYDFEEWSTFSQPTLVIPPQSPRFAEGPFGGFILDDDRTINGLEGFGRMRAITGAGLVTWLQKASNGAFRNPVVRGIVREDGEPDICGDPPGPVVEPDPIPPIPELPESPVIPPVVPNPDLPGGGGFVFKPTVGPITIGPDGGISIPVVINIGGPSLSVPITIPVSVGLPSFSPTIIVGGSGGVSTPGGGGGVTAPPRLPEPVCCRPRPIKGPEKEGEEGEALEDDEPQFRGRLIGVLVKSAVNPAVARISEIGQGGGEFNLFVPRLGSLYFNVAATTDVGEEAASTRDYPVKTLAQYIEAPPDINVTGYRLAPEPGVSMSASPVFVPANEDVEPEPE